MNEKRSGLPVILTRLRSHTVDTLTAPSQQPTDRTCHCFCDLAPALQLGMFNMEQADVRPIPDAQRGRTTDVYLSPYERR